MARQKTRAAKKERQIGSAPRFYKPRNLEFLEDYKNGRKTFEQAYREYIKMEIVPLQSLLRDLKKAYIYPDNIHVWARKFVKLDLVTGELTAYDYLTAGQLEYVSKEYKVMLMIANVWLDQLSPGGSVDFPEFKWA